MSYHQILVNKRLQPKLVYVGPGTLIYTYGFIPLGPVNDTVIFIWMMFNTNEEFQTIAIGNGVVISENTTTKIIVEDCFNWAI